MADVWLNGEFANEDDALIDPRDGGFMHGAGVFTTMRAGGGRIFWSVTLPLMWDVLTTGIIFLVIGGLKVFDTVWVMENGRPTDKTHTLSTLMYSKVFEEYNIGYGTAIAVLLFLLVLCATLLSFRLLRRESLEY